MTAKQEERQERYGEVASRFEEVKRINPGANNSALITKLLEEKAGGYAAFSSIRQALIATGCIKGKLQHRYREEKQSKNG